MGQFIAGEVVVVSFPFSNLKDSKSRPALVLARVEFDNLILCQITSKQYTSASAICLTNSDFSRGKLPVISYIRPDKLFTADPLIVTRSIGHLGNVMRNHVLGRVRQLFKG